MVTFVRFWQRIMNSVEAIMNDLRFTITITIKIDLRVECFDAEFAAPRALRRFLDLGHDAVHVVAAVAVVTEQKLKKIKIQNSSFRKT